MPTIFSNKDGYSYFFVSLDRGEPPHVHVAQGRKYAKFWLEPIELARSRNLRSHELNAMGRVIEQNYQLILTKWHEHFNR